MKPYSKPCPNIKSMFLASDPLSISSWNGPNTWPKESRSFQKSVVRRPWIGYRMQYQSKTWKNRFGGSGPITANSNACFQSEIQTTQIPQNLDYYRGVYPTTLRVLSSWAGERSDTNPCALDVESDFPELGSLPPPCSGDAGPSLPSSRPLISIQNA